MQKLLSTNSCEDCKNKERELIEKSKQRALQQAKRLWKRLLVSLAHEGKDCRAFVPKTVEGYFDENLYSKLERSLEKEETFFPMHRLMLHRAIMEAKWHPGRITCKDCVLNYL